MSEAAEDPLEGAPSTRLRILDAALALTQAKGPEAATTRAVAASASVQVPTIYRLFGDKQGLLDAVAEHALATYVAGKAERVHHADPLEELRHGWDAHVAFGLANPGLFALMSGRPHSPAMAQGLHILRARIRDVAAAGRLRTSEERAVAMIHACCTGLVLTLIAEGQAEGGDLSVATRTAVYAAVMTDAPDAASMTQQTAAAMLRASISEAAGLSRGEHALLDELLERLSRQRSDI